MIVLNLLSVRRGGILLLASADNMSVEVELLAVVWGGRLGSQYYILHHPPHYYPHHLKLIQGEREQSMKRHLDQQEWDYPVVWW